MSNELIRNCKFGYKCCQQWETMDDTADPSIKFCQVCKENVHLCEDDASLIEALKNNWCVALYDKYDSGIPTLVGNVSSEYFPADNN